MRAEGLDHDERVILLSSRITTPRNPYVSSCGTRSNFLKAGKLHIRVRFRVQYRFAITVCNSIVSISLMQVGRARMQ